MERVKYTADDENPDCMCCDHVCSDSNICQYCGPKFGWARYVRTERVNVNDVWVWGEPEMRKRFNK